MSDLIRKKAEQTLFQAAEAQAFHADGYFVGSCLTVFFPMGCSTDFVQKLEVMTNKLIKHKNTIQFARRAEDMSDAVGNLRSGGITNLHEVFFTPVIHTAAVSVEEFARVMEDTEEACRHAEVKATWRPFLLGVNYMRGRGWLAEYSDLVDTAHRKGYGVCRSALLLETDTAGRLVSDETNIKTLLLTSLIHSSDPAVATNAFSHVLEYKRQGEAGLHFYTAASLFVLAPHYAYGVRTLRYIAHLLAAACEGTSGAGVDGDMILRSVQPLYQDLPRGNDGYAISLLPLYSVMAEILDENNIQNFAERLNHFAYKHYLASCDRNQPKVLEGLHALFAEGIARRTLHTEFLQALKENAAGVIALDAGLRDSIAPLPPLPSEAGVEKSIQGQYTQAADKLQSELIDRVRSLLEGYFTGEQFAGILHMLEGSRQTITDLCQALDQIEEGSTPDFGVTDRANEDYDRYLQNAQYNGIALAKHITDALYALKLSGDKDENMAQLLEILLQVTLILWEKSNAAKRYLERLNDLCTITDSQSTTKCLNELDGKLNFPTGRYKASLDRRQLYYWGDKTHPFLSAYLKRHSNNYKMDNLAEEGFVALFMLSFPFGYADIDAQFTGDEGRRAE